MSDPRLSANNRKYLLGICRDPEHGKLIRLLLEVEWKEGIPRPFYKLREAEEEPANQRLEPWLNSDELRRFLERLTAESPRVSDWSPTDWNGFIGEPIPDLVLIHVCTDPLGDAAAVKSLDAQPILKKLRVPIHSIQLSNSEEALRRARYRTLAPRIDALAVTGEALADQRLSLAGPGETARRLVLDLGRMKTRRKVTDDTSPLAECLVTLLWAHAIRTAGSPGGVFPVRVSAASGSRQN